MKFIQICSCRSVYFLLDRKPHRVERQSLCGSEMTRRIKQLEVEGTAPQCDASAGRGRGSAVKTHYHTYLCCVIILF